jgi:hypothetical protein
MKAESESRNVTSHAGIGHRSNPKSHSAETVEAELKKGPKMKE